MENNNYMDDGTRSSENNFDKADIKQYMTSPYAA